jgi:hypothetical protein
MGTIVDNIAIGNFAWDGAISSYVIPISHIVSTANAYNVRVRCYSQGGGASTVFAALSLSAVYTLTALARQYPYYNDRLGIGTTGPSSKLHVSGDATDNVGLAFFENTSSGGLYFPAATFTNNNGNHSYGIVAGFKTGSASGTDRPSILFYSDLAAHSWSVGQVTSGWGNNDAFGIGYRASNDPNSFGTWPSNYFTILTSGNVGINTTAPSYRLDVSGDARITSGSLGVGVAPNATDGRIDASNDIVAFQTSDRRLKENITPITNALEKVKSLTGVMFDWKEETKSVHGYEGHDVGIIAQDVQAVLPEAVRTNDTGYLSVRYEKMIALLIEGMKEQQLQIDELKSKLK